MIMKRNWGVTEGKERREWSYAQRAAVGEEMSRLLAHRTFRKGKKCFVSLRCMVDHAHAGEVRVREHPMGMEAFGRNADNDNQKDPIVRRMAGEVRKLLAEYRQEGGHHAV